MARSTDRRTTASPGTRARPARRSSRRVFGTLGVLAAVAVVAVGAWAVLRWHRAASTPGPLVIISIDTLRADHLPVYGYRNVQTPAIDRLAADSVVFERAYSHVPQTLPAHATILTGLLPFQTGIRDNVGFTLRPGVRTLASAFHDAGFSTGGVVSAYVLRGLTGISRGFDFYDDHMQQQSGHLAIGDMQRGGEQSLDIARDWIASRTSPQFFLFFHIYEPHAPYTPPSRFAQYAPYDGEIAYSDEIVGRLLDLLRERKLYDRATIVLLSDHGEGLGQHGEEEHGIFIYEQTMRVPLVLKFPGNGRKGRFSPLVQHVDLVPTLLDMFGIAPPKGLAGRSLRPYLTDSAARPPAVSIYSESAYALYHFGWSELVGLTDDRFRYIRAPERELYDLTQDPGDDHNLAGAQQGVCAGMQRSIDTLTAGAGGFDPPSEISSEDVERLRSLGYVGSTASAARTADHSSLPDPKSKIKVLETFRRATKLDLQHQEDAAIPLLREVLEDSPGMTDAWEQLARGSMNLGRFDDAIEAYKGMAQSRPEDSAPVTGLARLLLVIGRTKDAREHAEMAVRLAARESVESRAAAHELAARVAYADGDIAAARAHATAAEQADPTLPFVPYLEAILQQQAGKPEEALALLQQAAERSKARNQPLAGLDLAFSDALQRLGRYQEAEGHVREELRRHPENVLALVRLALLDIATGRRDEAARIEEHIAGAKPTPERARAIEQLRRALHGTP